MADSVDAYLKQLEDDYEQPARVRKFFARPPRRVQLLRPNLGGGASVAVTLAGGQGNPVNAGPINFTVTFSEAATGFTNADVSFAGSTVGGTLAAAVTGTGPAYNVAVTGMTGNGGVSISIPAASATTTAKGLPFPASNTATVTFDTAAPSVTINVAVGQIEPTSGPIDFTAVFSEAVINFIAADVTMGGTAGGTKVATVTGGPSTYNVRITGMTTAGTVTASIAAGVCTDLAGNANTISTSTDNSAAFDPTVSTSTVQTYFFIAGQY